MFGRLRHNVALVGITTLFGLTGFVASARAQEPRVERAETVNLPLADYLDLVRKAREAAVTPPQNGEHSATLSAQRIVVRVAGEHATLQTRFEIDVRGAGGSGGAPVLLPVGGRISAVTVEPRSSSPTLYRSGSGDLAFVATAAGRYTVTVASRIERSPDAAESFAIPTRGGAAPISEVEVDLPAKVGWDFAGAVPLEERESGEQRHLRFAVTRESGGLLTVRSGAPAVTTPSTTVARSIVITHLDLGAEETLRLDTIQIEVLRGELAALEARLPPSVAVERAWMDDGSEVSITATAQGTVVGGKRKQRLTGTGFLKILSRRPGPPPPDYALENVEPSVAARARYLVVSSSVVATLAPLPAEAWSTIDLTDPPDSLERELAQRPPVGGWRLEGATVPVHLAIGLLPAVARIRQPITRRETTTLANADGTLLVQDRFEITDHRDALDLTLPEGMRFESATVDGDVVRPIERDGRHLLPLRFREGTTTVEISLTDRSLTAQKRASRRRFALPKLPAGADGEVLQHTWHLYLPPGIEGRYQKGELRPAPIRPDLSGYFSFDASEEMAVNGVVAEAPAPVMITRRDSVDAPAAIELEKVPTARDPWKLLRDTPGVQTDRLNVGGNESAQQSFNRSGTAIEVKPSLQPAPGSTEFLFTGALPPREIGVELEIKEKKAKRR